MFFLVLCYYIGFLCNRSNCLDKIGKELRTHYQKPTFLPTVSTSSSIDWIFMGGSGLGASMHVRIHMIISGFIKHMLSVVASRANIT